VRDYKEKLLFIRGSGGQGHPEIKGIVKDNCP